MDGSSQLRSRVEAAYSRAAEHPAAANPFPVGRQCALGLGYPQEWLDSLPAESVNAFTGVSNVLSYAEIAPGANVLDIGCGAGTDSLLAARRTGPDGRTVGLDFSEPMLRRARHSAIRAGAHQVLFVRAAAERMPVRSGIIDTVLVNGIFNLNPYREAIFQELARVLKPGGAVFAAELVLQAPLPAEAVRNPETWFS